jgi:hypothetical protein
MPERQPPPDRDTDQACREAWERQDAEVAAATRAVRPKPDAPPAPASPGRAAALTPSAADGAGLVSELLASGGLARQVSARGHAGVAPRRPRGVAADFASGVDRKPTARCAPHMGSRKF